MFMSWDIAVKADKEFEHYEKGVDDSCIYYDRDDLVFCLSTNIKISHPF